MGEKLFRKCPTCGEEWTTQEEFLDDNSVVINGYKPDFEQLEYGLFFFTHKKPECLTTMTLSVNKFVNLYTGKIYSERKTGEEECPGLCTDQEQLDRCDAMCECAFVREILSIIKDRRASE